jgi:hypothetical protein
MTEPGLPEFADKLLIVYVSNPPRGMDAGVFLEFSSFQHYGGRLFLTGRVPEKGDSGWASRLPAAVAWDSVVHYLVFDSRDDYERRTAKEQGTLRRRLLKWLAG